MKKMPKVLFIDDEPYVLEGLRTMINWAEYGFTVCAQATNGHDGLEALLNHRPELVITDIRIPGMNGLEVVKQARKAGCLSTSFIILSGYSDFSYIQDAMRHGVSAYLLKPLDEEEIQEALTDVCTRLKRQKSETPPGAPLFGADLNEEFRRSQPLLLNYNYSHDYFHDYIDGLLEEMKNNRPDGIEERINRLFQSFTRDHYALEIVQACIKNLELEVIKLILEYGVEMGEVSRRFAAFHQRVACTTGKKLSSELIAFCRDLAEYMASIEQNNADGLIDEIKAFTKENYDQNLNLQKLAEQFYINPVYLGQLFKKSTGVRFCDYLHGIRIDKAKKMLRRTNMKVAEIARAIGYRDPDYFVRKFKSITSSSPSAFKNKPFGQKDEQ